MAVHVLGWKGLENIPPDEERKLQNLCAEPAFCPKNETTVLLACTGTQVLEGRQTRVSQGTQLVCRGTLCIRLSKASRLFNNVNVFNKQR